MSALCPGHMLSCIQCTILDMQKNGTNEPGGAGLEKGGSVEFPFNGQAISQTWLFKEGM